MYEEEEHLYIEAAQKGNIDAFETLISIYEKKIYTICLRMMNHTEEASDATQEVCLKIWRQLKSFQGKSKFSTWIYRITMNECLDRLRKSKNKKNNIIKYEQEDLVSESAEEIIQNKVLQDILKQAILELKDEQRKMIVLRDINGNTYEQIADILNLSLGTVKSRISRARVALKRILQQDKEPYKSFFVKQGSKEEIK